MTPGLIRTLEWDSDKVRCTTCGLPWAEHPYNAETGDYLCIIIAPKARAAWWVKEEIRP